MDHAYLRACLRTCVVAVISCVLLACGGGKNSKAFQAAPEPIAPDITVTPVVTPITTPAVSPPLKLGAPTTNPGIIPPSEAKSNVQFLSVVSGDHHPDQVVLDEVDSDGNILTAAIALLKDDGEDSDETRGDRVYSGSLSLGGVMSEEKFYRVHVAIDETEISSGLGQFWISGCPPASRPSNPEKAQLDPETGNTIYVDEIIITIADDIAPQLSEINAIVSDVGGQVVGCIPSFNQYLIQVSGSDSVDAINSAIATLKIRSEITEASTNDEIISLGHEGEAHCDGQECHWYMDRIRADEAWDIVGAGSKEQSVAVIDNGVYCEHPELDCGITHHNDEGRNHGTAVASLVSAKNNDGSNLIGVAWNSAVYPYRQTSQFGMIEHLANSSSQSNIKVINISSGLRSDPGKRLKSAICTTINTGRLIVLAAGNAYSDSSCQTDGFFPQNYNTTDFCENGANLAKGLLVVGSTDANNNLADWSARTCSDIKHVDIFAPGKEIYAATGANGYAEHQGNSFAAPLVSASAAILWASEPALTVYEVHDRIIETAGTLSEQGSEERYHTSDTRVEGKPFLDIFHAVGGLDESEKPDIEPDPITLNAKTNVALYTYISADPITVSGIDISIPINIQGGFYAINGGPFTSAAGSVGNGQRVTVQVRSARTHQTASEAVLTLGSNRNIFRVTTLLADTRPDNFDFLDAYNAQLSQAVTSNTLNIPGINTDTPVEISGGFYSVGNGEFTSNPGTIAADQNIRIRVTAASTPETTRTATITIGGVSDTFSVETLDADTTPTEFTFTNQTSVAIGEPIISNSITVAGINTDAAISVSGGSFSINGGNFRTAATSVRNSDTVRIRHTSSQDYSSTTYTSLKIGSYNTTFRSTTPINTPPSITGGEISDAENAGFVVGTTLTGNHIYFDSENDNEGASVLRWLRNSSPISGATRNTYQLSVADSGQNIAYQITPIAVTGDRIGETVIVDTVAVINSAPSVENIFIIDDNGNALAVGDTLSIDYDFRDVDNDEEGSSTFSWQRNGLAIPGAVNNTYQMVQADAAQNIRVQVTPISATGIAVGPVGISNSVVTGNVPPVASNLVLTGDSNGTAIIGDSFIVNYLFSDVDNDIEDPAGSILQWTRNGAAISGATSNSYTTTIADNGQTIQFEYTPVALTGNQTGITARSQIITINTNPDAQNLEIELPIGGSGLVGETLTAVYTYADVESDLEGASTIRWINGSTQIGAGLTYLVDIADSGESINFEVTPIATTGSTNGSPVLSAPINISNSAPTVGNLEITAPRATITVGDTLLGSYIFDDADGDLEGSTTFQWFRDTAPVAVSQNYTVTEADIGRVLFFTVTPRAATGTATGSPASSGSVQVEPNDAPVISNVTIRSTSGSTTYIDTVLSATYDYNDNELDPEGLPIYRWLRNGSELVGTASTYTAVTADMGQSLIVEITPVATLGARTGLAVQSNPEPVNPFDYIPDTFTFQSRIAVPINSLIISNEVTITGITAPATIFTGPGEYRINGGEFTRSIGLVNNGDTVAVRVRSELLPGQSSSTDIVIGDGNTNFFVATTFMTISQMDNTPPIWINSPDTPIAHQIHNGTSGVEAMLKGDINGDGNIDVVTLSSQSGIVSWHENDGSTSPNFNEHVVSSSFRGFGSIALADIDGDADLDILHTEDNGKEIALYVNDGEPSPTFTRRVIASGESFEEIIIDDINGDGNVDVVTRKTRSPNFIVSVHQSDGLETPTFTEREIAISAFGIIDMTTGDIDGDNDTDIIFISENDETIGWYENDGEITPNFTPHSFVGPADLAGIEAEDFDLDGDLDLVTNIIGPATITWYENTGLSTPTFIQRDIYLNFIALSLNIRTDDIDGDGDMDILFSHDTGPENTSLILVENTLNYTSAFPSSLASGSEVIIPGNNPFILGSSADLNDDGSQEVISAEFGGASLNWHTVSQARLWVEEGETIVFNEGATDPDNNTLTYSINSAADFTFFSIDTETGQVTFANAPLFSSPLDTNTDNIYKASINVSDGLSSRNRLISIRVYANDEDDDDDGVPDINDLFPLNPDEHLDTDSDGTPDNLDDNDDNDAELDETDNAPLDLNSATPPTWNNPADPSFEISIATLIGTVEDLETADIDGDGEMDIILASQSSDRITWYKYDEAGPALFISNVVSNDINGVRDIASADLDGDGDTDIISVSAINNTLLWFQNDGTAVPSFAERSITTSSTEAYAIFPADIDGDNDFDILLISQRDSFLAWYENDGTSTPNFSERAINSHTHIPSSITAADINGDSRTDVITGGSGSIILHLNTDDILNPFVQRSVDLINGSALFTTTADIDADGDIDIIAAAPDHIIWYKNDGALLPSFSKHTVSSIAAPHSALSVIDIDLDGDLDVVSSSADNNTITVHENDGTPSPKFVDRIITTNAPGAVTVASADITGNSKPEIFSVSPTGDGIFWYSTAQRRISVTEGNTLNFFEDATDAESNTLSYSIVSGSDEVLVSIDSSTGEVTFPDAPAVDSPQDANGDNIYEMTINVSDGYSSIVRAVEINVIAN